MLAQKLATIITLAPSAAAQHTEERSRDARVNCRVYFVRGGGAFNRKKKKKRKNASVYNT